MSKLSKTFVLLLFFFSSIGGAGACYQQDDKSRVKENAFVNKISDATGGKETQSDEWKDTVLIPIPADSDKKYKVYLSNGANFAYEWKADSRALFFDLHAEPRGDRTGYFKTFEKGTKSAVSGSLVSEFEGTHGWYWQNTSDFDIIVTLKMKGDYQRLDIEVDQQTAHANAKAIVESLIERKKIEESWNSAELDNIEEKKFYGQQEWVVTFLNPKVPNKNKQTLYVFLTKSGVYIAANFSGK